MAQPREEDVPESWYHLGSRAVRQLGLFTNDKDRSVFLSQLSELDDQFGLEVHAFALMNTHYHLLIRSASGGLSPAMRSLGSSYARYFNREHGFTGAVFESRYFSDRITTDAHLLQVSSYIHLNPVEANLVRSPAESNWTSYGSYVGTRPTPRWLSTEIILGLIGGSHRYREMVECLQPGVHPTPPIASVVDSSASVESLDYLVASTAGVDLSDLRAPHRGASGMARSVALMLAAEEPASTISTLATRYGYNSSASTRKALARAKNQSEVPGDMNRLTDRVRQLCRVL